jgi:hypothetical protein
MRLHEMNVSQMKRSSSTTKVRRRRGVAAVIAMMYLIIFATLAVGFYATTNNQTIIGHNENSSAVALNAAESGADFMRYQLAYMNLPYGTTTINLMPNTSKVLGDALNGTPNMAGSTVTVSGGAINIPSATGWIKLDSTSGARFRATITQKPATNVLVITIRGGTTTNTATRGVRMEYKPGRYQPFVGISGITMSGGAFTDSYNSALGPYNAATAGKNGTIGSNGNITLSNTVKINGDARPGIGKTVTLLDTASVIGIKLPMSTPIVYPTVVLPVGATNIGDVIMSSGTQNVPGGTYLIKNLSLSGTAVVNWTGPVKLYIQGTYSVKDNVIITTFENNPKNRSIYFLPTCPTATWTGTKSCVGEIYAPDTNITITGGVKIFGRIVAKSINNSSTGGMHADDAMGSAGGTGAYSPDFLTYDEIK